MVERIKSLRLSPDDFETLEVIGRGAFGEVKVSEGWEKRYRVVEYDDI